MNKFFSIMAAVVAWLLMPLKMYFEITSANANAETAPPTDVGRPMPKLMFAVFVFLLLTVVTIASPPILGAVGLIFALMLVAIVVKRYMPLVYGNIVDILAAVGLALRRNSVSSVFA